MDFKMNWLKKLSQSQFSLFDEKSSQKKEKPQPQVSIWGLSPSGTLTVIINGKRYEYYGITPHEERQLENLLKHKNYSKFFRIIKQLSDRNMREPFKRTL